MARVASQNVGVSAIQYIWYFESAFRTRHELQILPVAFGKRLEWAAKCMLDDDFRPGDGLAAQLLYRERFC